MPGSQPDNACATCGRTIARDRTLCNACSGTAVPIGDQKRAEWARAAEERSPVVKSPEPAPRNDKTCASCGRPVASDNDFCNACSGHKRAEWARGAAERDAAWKRSPVVAPVPEPPNENTCDSCKRPIARDRTQCNACSKLHGKLCGVVLGRSGSGVSVLGMFDLDENQLPTVEQ